MQSRDSRGTAPLRQRWFIYAAGKGAYNLELWLFGLEEDREVGSAWLKFTDREVPDLGCSEPGLVMKTLVEYCFYPISLKEREKELPARLMQQWAAVKWGVLAQDESQRPWSEWTFTGMGQEQLQQKCLKRNGRKH